MAGKAKAAWGRALNDKGKQAAGAAEELAGVIQEKSADAQQAAQAGTDRVQDVSGLTQEAETKVSP